MHVTRAQIANTSPFFSKTPRHQKKSPLTFSFNQIGNSRPYANVASGSENNSGTQKSFPVEADPIADLLSTLSILEKSYDNKLLSEAFKNTLLALRIASWVIDRPFILYDGVVTLSNSC